MNSDLLCNYISGSGNPCASCPKRITMLYCCGFLQEEIAQNEENDE